MGSCKNGGYQHHKIWDSNHTLSPASIKAKQKSLSHVQLFATHGLIVHGILQPTILEWGAFSFSRGSPQPRDRTQVSPHCGQILYQLSHKGSPRILEWVAYPFSSGSSLPRNRTRVSCIADRFFTKRAIREARLQCRGFGFNPMQGFGFNPWSGN